VAAARRTSQWDEWKYWWVSAGKKRSECWRNGARVRETERVRGNGASVGTHSRTHATCNPPPPPHTHTHTTPNPQILLSANCQDKDNLLSLVKEMRKAYGDKFMITVAGTLHAGVYCATCAARRGRAVAYSVWRAVACGHVACGLASGVWRLASGVWRLASGVWRSVDCHRCPPMLINKQRCFVLS
jgi:hypothetical protein